MLAFVQKLSQGDIVFLLTLCIQILSMYLLAISKQKHFRQVFKRFPNQLEVKLIRIVAFVLLFLGVSLLRDPGWAIVSLYTISQLAIAILVTSFVLREKRP